MINIKISWWDILIYGAAAIIGGILGWFLDIWVTSWKL